MIWKRKNASTLAMGFSVIVASSLSGCRSNQGKVSTPGHDDARTTDDDTKPILSTVLPAKPGKHRCTLQNAEQEEIGAGPCSIQLENDIQTLTMLLSGGALNGSITMTQYGFTFLGSLSLDGNIQTPLTSDVFVQGKGKFAGVLTSEKGQLFSFTLGPTENAGSAPTPP